jgi:hypothetical protein
MLLPMVKYFAKHLVASGSLHKAWRRSQRAALLEYFHKHMRCDAAAVEKQQHNNKWQRQYNQRQLCKLAAMSSNAKEHAQQQLKRNRKPATPAPCRGSPHRTCRHQ